ncbi:MAG: peptidoglycan-binding protein [bacterium]|nr:peptidoglycan-binding protein [bacterium]
MAITITASVGRMGGVNRPDDVKKVQKLLNKVPQTEGGPKVPLAVDGICGPKTINAIQTFQLRHFGWKGADGRVDPEGRTLFKLNEYDVPGARVYMLSIRCVLEPGRFLDPRRGEHWFFEVHEVGKAARAVYHLSGDFERPPAHVPVVFLGEVETFPCGRPASGLESRGARYRTVYDSTTPPGEAPRKTARISFSELSLGFLSQSPEQPVAVQRVEIMYPAHIEPPPIGDDPVHPTPLRPVRLRLGRFNLVKCTPG